MFYRLQSRWECLRLRCESLEQLGVDPHKKQEQREGDCDAPCRNRGCGGLCAIEWVGEERSGGCCVYRWREVEVSRIGILRGGYAYCSGVEEQSLRRSRCKAEAAPPHLHLDHAALLGIDSYFGRLLQIRTQGHWQHFVAQDALDGLHRLRGCGYLCDNFDRPAASPDRDSFHGDAGWKGNCASNAAGYDSLVERAVGRLRYTAAKGVFVVAFFDGIGYFFAVLKEPDVAQSGLSFAENLRAKRGACDASRRSDLKSLLPQKSAEIDRWRSSRSRHSLPDTEV